MITSIATVSIGGTLDSKLSVIARAGFKGVEICEDDLVVFDGSPEDARAMMADLDLVCTAYQPFRDFEGLSASRRTRAFDRAERKFDLMQRLGAELMLVYSSTAAEADGDHARLAADFHELAERAAARGLRIAYEALAWGRHVNDHRDAWTIVTAADHPAIGLALNSFHSLARQVPTDSILAIDPARIFLVQLADVPQLDMNPFQWSRHHGNMPGQGDLPIRDYVAALLRIGYDGPLSLEVFNDWFRAGSGNVIAKDGLRSLLTVCDEAERSLARPPRLSPHTTVRGIDFIEIAASPEEAARIEPMLSGLGFSLTGRHRNKAVKRWRQGDINFVVNTQPRSFPESYDLAYGASVCAIGLLVDDVERTRARARQLSIDDFEEDAGPGNLRLPALRGVGGSLVYLIAESESGATWDHEFEKSPVAAPGFGLLRVDHLAAVVEHGEFLSWLLYWTTLFGMTKTAPQDILDPSGIVQSQVVESADGIFRMTLNGTDSDRTLAAHFLESALGGGIQHFAFTTADIYASADAMRAAGAEILPIPDNYYDDISARFGLDESAIAEMKSRNILYDVDGDGHVYLHMYTRAFEKRFFFEVVQRDGYVGYGAANSRVRLAAQSRYRDRAELL
ncbi:MAG: TIM barrel protein [Devosia sp.]|nr:TIM barrel protein [Devosia sp.]